MGFQSLAECGQQLNIIIYKPMSAHQYDYDQTKNE